MSPPAAGTLNFSVFVVEGADDDEDHRCGRRQVHLPTCNTKEENFTYRRHPPPPHRRRHHPKQTNSNTNFLFVTVIMTLTSMLAMFPLSSSYSLSSIYDYHPSSLGTSSSSSSSSGRHYNEAIIMDETNNSPDYGHHLPLVTEPRRRRRRQRRNLQVVDASTTTVKEIKTTTETTATTAAAESSTTKKDGTLVLQDPETNTEEVCEPVEGTCQQCTFSEQKSYEECVPTGRWMKYQCTPSTTTTTSASSSSSGGGGGENGDGDGEDPPRTRIYMKSCQYTQSDEEFAMVSL